MGGKTRPLTRSLNKPLTAKGCLIKKGTSPQGHDRGERPEWGQEQHKGLCEKMGLHLSVKLTEGQTPW